MADGVGDAFATPPPHPPKPAAALWLGAGDGVTGRVGACPHRLAPVVKPVLPVTHFRKGFTRGWRVLLTPQGRKRR